MEDLKRGLRVEEKQLQPMSAEEFKLWLISPETRLSGRHVQGDEKVVATVDTLYKKVIENCLIEPSIDCSALKNQYVNFENCEFKSTVNLSVHELSDTIEFSSCCVKSVILYCEKGGININNCSCDGNIHLNGCCLPFGLKITDTDIKRNVRISNLETSKYHSPEFKNVNCLGEFLVDSETAIPVFYVRSGNYEKVRFVNSVAELILGTQTSQTKIKTLDFSSYTFPAKITVENMEITNLKMDYVFGKETNFEFIDTTILNEWWMTYAIPANLATFNLNLSRCKLYFDNSLLTNCIFSNTAWPKRSLLHSNQKERKAKNRALQETYRQLKQAMLKDGNNIDALAFYRNEMNSYWSYAWWNSQVKKEDKFILFISLIFSNHGQSFVLPLVWLLVVHFLLFWTLVGKFGYEDFQIFVSNGTCDAFKEQLGHYLYFLNPVHKTPSDFSGSKLTVDFLMRLSSGFFIYHIIRASRKFAKV